MSAIFIWHANPIIIQLGPITLRWYGLCFATAFLVALPIWYYMFNQAGKEYKEAERLQRYLTLGVIIGARLGHMIFYEWEDWDYYLKNLSKVFIPFTFSPKFEIVGFQGLASHGAAMGMALAIFLYLKPIKISLCPLRIRLANRFPGREFLWILDHLVILIALGGAFIRMGNFANSEIYGKPTRSNYGIVFANELVDQIYAALYYTPYSSTVANIKIHKNKDMPITNHYQPIQMVIDFKDNLDDKQAINNFLQGAFKNELVRLSSSQGAKTMIHEPYGVPLAYTLSKKESGKGYQAIVSTYGIPRHPSQLYESFSCFLIFIILFFWWYKTRHRLVPGRLAGTFMVLACTLRFFYEFHKVNQALFENSLWLNMGQLLSLPWIIIGLVLIVRSFLRPHERYHIENRIKQ